MKDNAINALIISMDTRLKRILTSNESDIDQVNIRLESSLVNFRSLPKSDSYIFDVELTNNDLISTVATIYKLKKSIGDKPLILIGKKDVLKKVQQSETIEGMVSRTINKPISYGQIQLAVNSSLSKSFPLVEPQKLNNKSNQRRFVVASLIAAFVLVSAITYFKTNKTPFSESNLPPIVVNQNSDLPDSIDPNNNTPQIDALNQSALLAVDEGRLSEPANDNAIYYLKQIKKLDPYNNTANKTHHKLFQLLEARYIDHSSKNNQSQAKKALETILDYEPYNHKYAVLLRELNERIYLDNLNKVNTRTQDNADFNDDKNTEVNSAAPINASSRNENKSQRTVEIKPSAVIESSNDSSVNIDQDQYRFNNDLIASIDQNINIEPEASFIQAKIIKKTEPYYPKIASELNYEGWIELEYQVDTNGLATNIKVLDGQKIKTFENAAIKALKQWTFAPATDSANSIPTLSEPMTANFNFQLN